MHLLWSSPAARALTVAALLLFPAAGTAQAPQKQFHSSFIYLMNTVTLSDKVKLELEYYTNQGGAWKWVKKSTTLNANDRAYLTAGGSKVTASKVRGSYTYRKANKKNQTVHFKYDVNPGGKATYKAKSRHKFDLGLRDQVFSRAH